MDLSAINWWAVLLSTAVAMMIGALWYSNTLFGEAWRKTVKISKKDWDNPAPMVGATLFFLIISITLALLINDGGLLEGVFVGSLSGIGLAATSVGVLYGFEARPLSLFLINASYLIIALSAIGAVIGAL